MFRARLIQLVAGAALVGLLAAAAAFAPGINSGRQELNMIGTESAHENTPPEYAFAIQAFGAFRSLVCDIAFIRAEELKEEGRYYEAMQLANWICQLQPRFPAVWSFQAWNMAWNISVTTFTPEERWNWVYNGVRLLRDEGLRYNPRSLNMYKQLAWIFNNKMGENVDEFHMTYKRQWAWRMHLLFGNPPDPMESYRPDQPFEPLPGGIGTGELVESAEKAAAQRELKEQLRAEREGGEYRPGPTAPAAAAGPPEQPTQYEIARKAAWLRIKAIADAPRTLKALYAQTPETVEMVAELRRLGVRIDDERLDEDRYMRPDGLALSFFDRYRQLADPVARIAAFRRDAGAQPDAQAELLQEFDRIVGVRDKLPAGLALLRFLQGKVLREVYKLDPEKMARVTQTFGPVDWRTVDSQSLYWIMEALIRADETVASFRNDRTNTARILFFSLRNLYLRNKITFEPNRTNINYSYLNLAPDLNFVEPLHQAYRIYGPLIDPDPGRGGAGETYRPGHISFLSEAIQILYFADRRREAERYYEYLRETYYTTDTAELNPLFNKTLRDFVVDNFREAAETRRGAESAISGLLISAYNQLADGNATLYANLVRQAGDIHETYMRDKWRRGSDRQQLPPFVEMEADVLAAYLTEPSVSYSMTLRKAALWEAAPLPLKQMIYDAILPWLQSECEVRKYDVGEFDVQKAFPEPPGMDEYRRTRGEREQAPPEDQVETPAQPL